mmetsp:Transcript_8235/g.16397  ORF Transcript_8235/g.16397 Transcript_8235/m.16397 type:complete len:205 (+) Transcript_8235:1792-2406(+)
MLSCARFNIVVLKKDANPPPMTTIASALDALPVDAAEHVPSTLHVKSLEDDAFSSRSFPRSFGNAWLESADPIMARVPIANGRISPLASEFNLALTSFLRALSSDGFRASFLAIVFEFASETLASLPSDILGVFGAKILLPLSPSGLALLARLNFGPKRRSMKLAPESGLFRLYCVVSVGLWSTLELPRDVVMLSVVGDSTIVS